MTKRPEAQSSSLSRATFTAAFAALILLFIGVPAAAQCNPSADPSCGSTPGIGPDVGISPLGGDYTAATPGGTTIPLTIAFTDPEGVNGATLQVKLWNAGSSVPVAMTWSTNFDGSRVTAQGDLALSAAGDNILVAQVANKLGVVGSARATFRLTFPDPNAPVISLDPHHGGFRNTSQGALTLVYPAASYTSMGVTRTTALLHSSDLARPAGFIQVDAHPGYGDTTLVTALSLRVERWNNGATGTQALVVPEIFYRKAGGKQRLGAYWWWNAQVATGSYKVWAVVRAYKDNGSYTESRKPVRMLILNEASSRYGGGWIVAGVKRLFVSGTDGVMISEGNGVLRFFEGSCASAVTNCSYVTPEGDFSQLSYRPSSGTWLRTYLDGSQEVFTKAAGQPALGLQTSSMDRFFNVTSMEWQATQDGTNTPILSRIVDPVGHATTFAYDAGGYLRSVTAAGRTVTATINSAKQLTNIAGPPNLQLTYDSYRQVSSYNWNYSAGTVTDPGVTTDVAYNDAAKVKSITAAAVVVNGQSVRPKTTYKSNENAVVPEAWWDVAVTRALPAAAVVPEEAFAEVTDAGGHLTRVVLDRYGNPTTIIDPSGTTTMKWTAAGLLESASSPSQYSKNVWSSKGQLLLQTVNGAAVYEAAYNAMGLPEFIRSGKTGRWYSYGARGEILKTWYGKQQDAQRTGTTYTYNARYQVASVVDPKGRRTELSHGGNVWANVDSVRVVRQDGTISTASFTYDDRSRTRTESNPNGETTTTDYDSLNRPVAVVDPMGRSISYQYTGPYLTKFTDAGGKAYEFTYNALGWLETELFPDGGATLASRTRTNRYDIEGQRISSTNRRGQTVTMAYDATHRLRSRVADGVTTSFDFPDVYTRVITNPESAVTAKVIPDVGSPDHVTATLAGRRFEIKRVYEIENAYRDLGFDLNVYSGDSLLRIDKMRLQSEGVPADPGLSASISLKDFGGMKTFVDIDTAGRPVRVYFPNGISETNSFTSDGRLNATTFSSATVNQKLGGTFSYDFLSRLNTRTSPSEDRYWSYGYNAAGLLTSYGLYNGLAEGCGLGCPPPGPVRQEAYSYDASGNRTDRGGVVAPGTNRYTQFNGFSLEYDAEGNVTRKYKSGYDQRMTWNSLGQLASVTTNGIAVSYGYDGLGRRVRRTEGGVSRYTLYDGDDILMETDQNGEPLRTYTHWPGIDTPHSVRVSSGTGPGSVYYYTVEKPGHVTGLLNAAGAVAAEYRYTPFGEVESATDPIGQPLRFMSRELDSRTGLYYVRARWYDAALARFISQDPIGLAGGTNLYAYVGNDPVNRRDPSGLQWHCQPDGSNTCTGGPVMLDPVTVVAFRNLFTGAWVVQVTSLNPRALSFFQADGSPFDDVRGLIVPMTPPRRTPKPAAGEPGVARQTIDCGVNAFEGELQGGIYVSGSANLGPLGGSLTIDGLSIHAGVKDGHFQSSLTHGIYGDVTYAGETWTYEGFKLEHDFFTRETELGIARVEHEGYNVPLGGGGGVLIGGSAKFQAGEFVDCVKAALKK